MTKVLVERELLELIERSWRIPNGYPKKVSEEVEDIIANGLGELRSILAKPAHDVEASVPTFPCESCGTFHSYSEVAEADGYCPQCEADYDERKMLADLLARYAALAAAPKAEQPPMQGEK